MNPVSNPQPSDPLPESLLTSSQSNLTDNEFLASIIETFLANSNCATKKEQKEYLLKLLGNKRLVTYMLYRGSEHGWMLKDFHSRCDNKGPTISLFKVKDGDCIGGYTKTNWEYKTEYYYNRDNDAILFNLSRQRYFSNKGGLGSIY